MSRRRRRPSSSSDTPSLASPPRADDAVTAAVTPSTSVTLRRGRPWTLTPDVNRGIHTRVEAASTLPLAGCGQVRPSAAIDSDGTLTASASGRVGGCVSFDAAASRAWPRDPASTRPPSASLDVRLDERYRAPSYGAVIERRARLRLDSGGKRPWATVSGVGRPVKGASALGFELGSDLADCTALALSGDLAAGGGGGGAQATSRPSPPPSSFKFTGWVPVGSSPRPGWRLDARGGGSLGRSGRGAASASGVVCTGGGPPGTPLASSTWALELTLAAAAGGAELTTRLSAGGVRCGLARGAGARRVAASVDVTGAPRALLTLGGGPFWSAADGPVGPNAAGDGAPRAGVAADAKGGVRAWVFAPF